VKRLLLTAMTVLLLSVGTTRAGDFEDALTANARADYPKALRLLRALAAEGNAKAQYNLGLMYRNGQGIAQDYAEAAEWFRRAAEQGDAEAQLNLGLMYGTGQGVKQKYSEAVKWYRLAATQGDLDAQFNLGVMYANGQGVPKDYGRAYIWFSLGAVSGDADAVTNRDTVAKLMTPQQITEAQAAASGCQVRKFKGCY
jgi:TPR repeat protein